MSEWQRYLSDYVPSPPPPAPLLPKLSTYSRTSGRSTGAGTWSYSPVGSASTSAKLPPLAPYTVAYRESVETPYAPPSTVGTWERPSVDVFKASQMGSPISQYGLSQQEQSAIQALSPYYNPQTREFDYARAMADWEAQKAAGEKPTHPHYYMWTLGMKAPTDIETYEAYGEKGKELFFSTGLHRPMHMSGIDPLTGKISPGWSLSGLTRQFGTGAHLISEKTESIPVVGFVTRAGFMGTLEVEKYWQQHGAMSWFAVPGTIAAGTVTTGAGQVVFKGVGWGAGKLASGFSTKVVAPMAVKYPTAYAIGKGAYGLATLPAKGVQFVGGKVVKPAVFGKYSPIMGKYTPQGAAVRGIGFVARETAIPIESKLVQIPRVGGFGGKVGWWRPPEYFKPAVPTVSVSEGEAVKIATTEPSLLTKEQVGGITAYGETMPGRVTIGAEAPRFQTTTLEPVNVGGELPLGQMMQFPALKQPMKIMGGDFGVRGEAITGIVAAPPAPSAYSFLGKGARVTTKPIIGGGTATQETLEQQLIHLPEQAKEKLLVGSVSPQVSPAPRIVPVISPVPVEVPAVSPMTVAAPSVSIQSIVEPFPETQPLAEIQPVTVQEVVTRTAVEQATIAEPRPAVLPYAEPLVPLVPIVPITSVAPIVPVRVEPPVLPIIPPLGLGGGVLTPEPREKISGRATPLSEWQIEGLEVYSPSLFLRGPKKVGGRIGRKRIKYGAVVPKGGLVNVKAYKQTRENGVVRVRKHTRGFPHGRELLKVRNKWHKISL